MSTPAKISPFLPIWISQDYLQEYPKYMTQLLLDLDLLLKIPSLLS